MRLCPAPLGELLNGPTRDIVLTTVRAFTSEVLEKTQQVSKRAVEIKIRQDIVINNYCDGREERKNDNEKLEGVWDGNDE